MIRDDVSGLSRVAVIDPTGHAHWGRVQPGRSHGNEFELVAAPFGAGTRVVITEQVGLPEGEPQELGDLVGREHVRVGVAALCRRRQGTARCCSMSFMPAGRSPRRSSSRP